MHSALDPQPNERGFTLIELLVVISIIAVLSMIGMTIYTTVQNNTRINATKATLDAVYKAIEQQRILQQKTLLQVTGNGCTACACGWGDNFNEVCLVVLNTTFVTKLNMESIPRDGWGDPILTDENEGEFGPDDCRDESIWSIHDLNLTIPPYLCSN